MAKPRKVEDPVGTYEGLPKKGSAPVQPVRPPAVRYARSEDVRKANAKLMQVHREVLQELAQ